MMEITEKAASYAEGKAYEAITKAITQAYVDGYRDGYKDRENKRPVDLRDKTEYVDLGLPSGTLWSADYEKEDEEVIYLPFEQAKGFPLPTEGQWNELLHNCKWQGHYSSSGSSFYGITIIGPNGNSIQFKSKGYNEDSILRRGTINFWLSDNENSNEKLSVEVSRGIYREPQLNVWRCFMGFKLPLRLVSNINKD